MTDTSYDWEARQLDRGDLAAIPAQKSTTPTEPISTFLTPQWPGSAGDHLRSVPLD